MRDLVLLLVFIALCLVGLRKHHVPVLIWAWMSLMNPNRLTYGFAYTLPFAQTAAILVFVVFLATKDKWPYPSTRLATLLVSWYLWMTVTSIFSFNDMEPVLDYWIKVSKIFVMLIFTAMMLRGRDHIKLLATVMAFSLGFYGFKGGLHTARGGTMVSGPPGSFIEVSNHLAVAMVMIVPLIYFLANEQPSKLLRQFLYVVMAMCVLSIFGTTSRGAFLGAMAMAFFLGMKSQRKILTMGVGSLVLLGLMAFMPDEWSGKMEGISTYEDHSAQSRLYTWQMIWNLVLHNPIVGGGFVITENPQTWQTYAVTEYLRAYSPHSIYFQVLSEHGFVGFFLYMMIWLTTWRTCTAIIKRATTPETRWAANLARMVQPSIIGFLVGGAFVNLAHYDLPFYFVMLVILTDLAVPKAQPGPPARAAA